MAIKYAQQASVPPQMAALPEMPQLNTLQRIGYGMMGADPFADYNYNLRRATFASELGMRQSGMEIDWARLGLDRQGLALDEAEARTRSRALSLEIEDREAAAKRQEDLLKGLQDANQKYEQSLEQFKLESLSQTFLPNFEELVSEAFKTYGDPVFTPGSEMMNALREHSMNAVARAVSSGQMGPDQAIDFALSGLGKRFQARGASFLANLQPLVPEGQPTPAAPAGNAMPWYMRPLPFQPGGTSLPTNVPEAARTFAPSDGRWEGWGGLGRSYDGMK